jgi:hypothetical protein
MPGVANLQASYGAAQVPFRTAKLGEEAARC